MWREAVDGTNVYYPLHQPGGGMKALEIATGKVKWNAAIEADHKPSVRSRSSGGMVQRRFDRFG
jgi:hypothetical protein